MDLTQFFYITEIPEVIDALYWAEFSARCYNLGLTAVWFVILSWLFDLVFKCFNRNYRKGSD